MSPFQNLKLIINLPGQPAQEMELDNDSYTLGRSSECNIVVASPLVSRKHGLLERKGENWVYTDLNSQNGSLFNGQRVQQLIIRDGTRLQLGKDPARAVGITFQLAAPVKGPVYEATRVDVAPPSPVRAESPLPHPTQDAGTTCPRCHISLKASSRFCPNCGLNLDAPREARLPSTMTFVAPVEAASQSASETIPEFVVHEVGGSVQTYALTKTSMRLGRAPDNDIVISSPLVSNHHLEVEIHAGRVMITDLNSTNGTQVNGARIAPNQRILLQEGDVLRVGDLHGNSLQISLGGAEGNLRTKAAGNLDLSKLATQPKVLIGRATTCDLCIPHPSVSKHHAMVFRQGGRIAIQDLGSRNGTFVNGVRVTQANLSDGDEIQVGPFHLVYDDKQHNLAGSRRLGHRLDAVRLTREVKGGAAILNDVSVSIQSSEFVALVGGSGAGKSTLMKALNGYEPATKGQMLIDGQDLYSRLDMLRTEMGYVPQDDIIHRELPVRLALWYAAKLRLPDASDAEINKTIDDALKSVEMTEHQQKRVKDLSGGQRKRVSIASELLAQPSLFFLDEPTSGLDPGLEKKMMYDLKRLADQGRTIVLVTHATTNIEQCDYVAFMAKGRLAYYGPPKEAPKFFDSQDFADIYQKLSYEINPERGVQPLPELKAEYQEYAAASNTRKVSAGVVWAEKFRKSELYQKYVVGKQANLHDSRKLGGAGGRSKGLNPFSFLQQTYYLARRQVDLIRHDLRTLLILLVMLPMIGLLFGISSDSWWLTGKGWTTSSGQVVTADFEAEMKADLKGKPKETSNTYTPYMDASTLVAMIALALTQGGTFGASYEIVKERPIFTRERAVNLSVWAYVISKMVVLSLFAFVQVGGLLLLVGMFVDLNVPGIIFPDFSILEIFISLYLAILASIGLGLLISALVPSTDVVLYVILAQLFLQIVLTGTLFPVDAGAASYITPGYWATDSLSSIVDLPRLDADGRSCVVKEIPDVNMTTGATTTKLDIICDKAASNAESLKDYKHETDHLLISWFAMGAQTLMWILLTVFIQSRKKSGRD
jgi:ABC-type multidrug transport system ATPase subunit/pSer/pThr/pTyr-binding forkhead associated (FHA) protein